MSDQFGSTINTKIWNEAAQEDNPFAAESCHCHGYDVYADILGKATFIEYLYLLFKGKRPNSDESNTLQLIAITLANPGPRDPSVHAAMAAYVTGSPAANALVAALSVGAGSYQGAREVRLAVETWITCGSHLDAWNALLSTPPVPTRTTIWPHSENPPGFDPYGKTCALPVRQALLQLSKYNSNHNLAFLNKNRLILEAHAKKPINMLGVIAAALSDLAFSPDEAEMLTLILRLPGAAVHALEQKQLGFRQFPFFDLELKYDPAMSTQTEVL